MLVRGSSTGRGSDAASEADQERDRRSSDPLKGPRLLGRRVPRLRSLGNAEGTQSLRRLVSDGGSGFAVA